jgi:hypothetical protein
MGQPVPSRAVRQRSVLVVIPVVVFLAVTLGLRPIVNLVARLRSPSGYRQYGMSGTWLVGLLAAAVAVAVESFVLRTRRGGPEQ